MPSATGSSRPRQGVADPIPIKVIERRDPCVTHGVDFIGCDAPLRPDREPDRRRTGVGQQLEPAPARDRLGQLDIEPVRRVVVDHLAQPAGDDQECLERLGRERFDRERGMIDTPLERRTR